MKLQIKEPCSEDWSKMTPTEKGRFCDKCEKCVVDFSHLSTPQLHKALKGINGNICGRFSVQQIENYNNFSPIRYNFRQWSLAAALAASIFNPTIAQNNSPVIEEAPIALVAGMPISIEMDNVDRPIDENPIDSIIIQGTLTSNNTEKLLGIVVEVAHTKFRTTTDLEGNFRLKLPVSKEFTLIVSAVDHNLLTHKLAISQEVTEVHLKLEPSSVVKPIPVELPMMMGLPIISHPTKQKKQKKENKH